MSTESLVLPSADAKEGNVDAYEAPRNIVQDLVDKWKELHKDIDWQTKREVLKLLQDDLKVASSSATVAPVEAPVFTEDISDATRASDDGDVSLNKSAKRKKYRRQKVTAVKAKVRSGMRIKSIREDPYKIWTVWTEWMGNKEGVIKDVAKASYPDDIRRFSQRSHLKPILGASALLARNVDIDTYRFCIGVHEQLKKIKSVKEVDEMRNFVLKERLVRGGNEFVDKIYTNTSTYLSRFIAPNGAKVDKSCFPVSCPPTMLKYHAARSPLVVPLSQILLKDGSEAQINSAEDHARLVRNGTDLLDRSNGRYFGRFYGAVQQIREKRLRLEEVAHIETMTTGNCSGVIVNPNYRRN